MTCQQYNNLINGQWLAGNSTSANRNPSNLSDVVGEYAQADAAGLDAAVQAAQAAFPAWSTSGIQARADALDRIGTEILARREELGTLLSREEGKTRPEGIGEATRAGQIFKFFAGECLRLSGE
ncbi:MAG TPA: aldehyde dehydrogenase family protein, partial [Polaromonas sp.]